MYVIITSVIQHVWYWSVYMEITVLKILALANGILVSGFYAYLLLVLSNKVRLANRSLAMVVVIFIFQTAGFINTFGLSNLPPQFRFMITSIVSLAAIVLSVMIVNGDGIKR